MTNEEEQTAIDPRYCFSDEEWMTGSLLVRRFPKEFRLREGVFQFYEMCMWHPISTGNMERQAGYNGILLPKAERMSKLESILLEAVKGFRRDFKRDWSARNNFSAYRIHTYGGLVEPDWPSWYTDALEALGVEFPHIHIKLIKQLPPECREEYSGALEQHKRLNNAEAQKLVDHHKSKGRELEISEALRILGLD